MTKADIIKELEKRTEQANKTIEAINAGKLDKTIPTKQARESAKHFQYGFNCGVSVAIDYLKNYLQ